MEKNIKGKINEEMTEKKDRKKSLKKTHKTKKRKNECYQNKNEFKK